MKRWLPSFLAGAAVTAACLLSAPAAIAEDAAALVAKGRTFLEKKDYPSARDAFLAAVKAAPKDAEARRGAAEALLGLGASDQAIDQATAGLDAVQDRDGGLWLLLARGYLQKGDRSQDGSEEATNAYADARAKAAMALQKDASLNGARSVIARVCRLTGDAEEAQRILEEGLGKDPRDFDLLYEQGMLHIKNGKHSAAVESFARACEVDPGSAEAHLQRGFSLAFTRDWDMAYAAFARSATLDPTLTKPLFYIAKYAGDQSPKWYRAILKEKPDHAWAHAYLAYYLAWSKTKDEAGAVTSMKAALAGNADNADLQSWAGLVYEGLGRADDAMKAYVKAFNLNPMVTRAWDKLMERATAPPPFSSAKLDERRVLIALLASKRPDDGVFWNNVGLMYRDIAKDYKASLEAYLRAAPLSPDDQGIQNDTGLIYLYHGKSIGEDPKQGLPYFLKTVALVEEDGQAFEMGYRDSLENLAVYYMDVEKDPVKALDFAKRRNDPDFIRNLDASIAQASQRAAGVRSWAEGQVKK